MNHLYMADNMRLLKGGIGLRFVDMIYLDPPAPGRVLKPKATLTGDVRQDDLETYRYSWAIQDHPQLLLIVEAARTLHDKMMVSHLEMLAPRISDCRHMLKPTGSIFVHTTQHTSHYVRIILDTIFGHKNFCNEIVLHYESVCSNRKRFPRRHDTILFYAKNKKKMTFNPPSTDSLIDNQTDCWKLPNDWLDKEHNPVYESQKPMVLMEEIIKCSTNEGDLVLDPYCGSGTTLIAAQMLLRNWIGIEWSPRAFEIFRARIKLYPEIETPFIVDEEWY